MIHPLRNIVVGIPTIHETEPLLRTAIEMAERSAATLHLVHAYEMPTPLLGAAPHMGYLDGKVLDRYAAEVQRALEERVRGLAIATPVRCHARLGPPAGAIHEVAGEVGADLILVGSTRRGAVERALLGTTAQRVMRGAPAPVLVVRKTLREPQRVLLATDLSPFSAGVHELALDALASVFPTADPRFVAMCVVSQVPGLPVSTAWETVMGSVESELEHFLGERRPRGKRISLVVRSGIPPKEILAETAEWGADLIVVGTHSRSGPARWLLGSVAEAVTRGAPVNVLVIPAGVAARRNLPVRVDSLAPPVKVAVSGG